MTPMEKLEAEVCWRDEYSRRTKFCPNCGGRIEVEP